MKWQWKLGRFFGIDVYIHATFLLIIAFVAWSHWSQGAARVVDGVVFVLAIFACVVAHEYGHALTARKFGIKTRDITLYPIGGVARLERMPDKPIQELWVALAGPAVNVVIAGVLYFWLVAAHAFRPFGELTVTGGPFLERLLVTNLLLVGFNLIPAFPMDGGRVLRALLAMKLEYTRATGIAAGIGQGTALLFGLWGLVGNPMLLFIALFVWIGAAQEASMVQMKSALAGIPVSRAMLTDFKTLAPTDPLARGMELLVQGSQQDFPVVDNGAVAGILTRADLLKALAQQSPTTPVSAVMRRDFPQVEAGEMLEGLFARLQECQCHTVPVTRNGTLAGLVTSENIGEFLMIQAALKGRGTALVPPVVAQNGI
ncbi:MAG: putative zinc metalloprotease Rip3 [Verrucomicrobiae bacterium]|nr:putative zinc metalloprotease Rip3 [Verrucomicrobiae bacterium]